ncbi:hypothetical protein K3172_13865 [Qipengyuania sp. 6B39]|uniref:hypothetical protein n=1 Tax=Qipengyuania proteolytica TaxID=2867239 RepID=UPI001C8ABEE4|nr:hypothetical protein [Qipengyuania proteolytica]MBX7496944.1 hypothetical protein [Qipengyuania proteolytica]
MRNTSLPRFALLTLPVLLAACGSASDRASEEVASRLPDQAPLEADELPAPTPAGEGQPSLASTMPAALHGAWRQDDLGRPPTAEDCNQTSSTNRNFGKVLTVRETGYSNFETGGRIMEVHARTDDMIDATFDTTYADTPTSERRDFALQADGTLAVNADDGDGAMNVTQYRRCPE